MWRDMTTKCWLASLAIVIVSWRVARTQDDVADVASRDLRVAGDEQKRYFLIGPSPATKAPDEGYGLVVVLPGGDGSADFHPFVKRVFKHALPDGYLVAQPVAVKWSDKQTIVWPTAKSKVAGAKFTTEELIDEVIDDVARQHKLNAKRVFTLSWSSGGPAAYATSLSNGKVTGSLVAMSIFRPAELPPLENAKGHVYYLLHSPDDRVCPFRMARDAAKSLEANGANVKLTTYDGGHGWQGDIFGEIRDGILWLEKTGSRHPGPAE
jgi:predicted esterase